MIRQSVAVSITYGFSVGLVSLAVVPFPFSAYALLEEGQMSFPQGDSSLAQPHAWML
jgi:hypothetical protein